EGGDPRVVGAESQRRDLTRQVGSAPAFLAVRVAEAHGRGRFLRGGRGGNLGPVVADGEPMASLQAFVQVTRSFGRQLRTLESSVGADRVKTVATGAECALDNAAGMCLEDLGRPTGRHIPHADRRSGAKPRQPTAAGTKQESTPW